VVPVVVVVVVVVVPCAATTVVAIGSLCNPGAGTWERRKEA